MADEGRRPYVFDSSVLIDYLDVDPSILTSFAQSVGPSFVVVTLLDEIDQLDEPDCHRLGLSLYEPTWEQLAESREAPDGLSEYDYLVFIVARDNRWTCVTADQPLWELCDQQGVDYIRGLRPLIELVRGGHIEADVAVRVAEEIAEANSYITAAVLEQFMKIIEEI